MDWNTVTHQILLLANQTCVEVKTSTIVIILANSKICSCKYNLGKHNCSLTRCRSAQVHTLMRFLKKLCVLDSWLHKIKVFTPFFSRMHSAKALCSIKKLRGIKSPITVLHMSTKSKCDEYSGVVLVMLKKETIQICFRNVHHHAWASTVLSNEHVSSAIQSHLKVLAKVEQTDWA